MTAGIVSISTGLSSLTLFTLSIVLLEAEVVAVAVAVAVALLTPTPAPAAVVLVFEAPETPAAVAVERVGVILLVSITKGIAEVAALVAAVEVEDLEEVEV